MRFIERNITIKRLAADGRYGVGDRNFFHSAIAGEHAADIHNRHAVYLGRNDDFFGAPLVACEIDFFAMHYIIVLVICCNIVISPYYPRIGCSRSPFFPTSRSACCFTIYLVNASEPSEYARYTCGYNNTAKRVTVIECISVDGLDPRVFPERDAFKRCASFKSTIAYPQDLIAYGHTFKRRVTGGNAFCKRPLHDKFGRGVAHSDNAAIVDIQNPVFPICHVVIVRRGAECIGADISQIFTAADRVDRRECAKCSGCNRGHFVFDYNLGDRTGIVIFQNIFRIFDNMQNVVLDITASSDQIRGNFLQFVSLNRVFAESVAELPFAVVRDQFHFSADKTAVIIFSQIVDVDNVGIFFDGTVKSKLLQMPFRLRFTDIIDAFAIVFCHIIIFIKNKHGGRI